MKSLLILTVVAIAGLLACSKPQASTSTSNKSYNSPKKKTPDCYKLPTNKKKCYYVSKSKPTDSKNSNKHT